MSNTRGWTFTDDADEPEADEAYEARVEVVEALVARWNQLHNELEEYQFTRGRNREITEAQARVEQIRLQGMRDEMSAIEEQLGELGARVMRPYEHWNEDEAYMQYMEQDRYPEEPDDYDDR